MCAASAAPTTSPRPVTTLRTPAGTPASERQLGQPDRRQRRRARRLEDDRVAGRERRADLPDRHPHRVVPGRDLADDADRLAPDEARVAAACTRTAALPSRWRIWVAKKRRLSRGEREVRVAPELVGRARSGASRGARARRRRWSSRSPSRFMIATRSGIAIRCQRPSRNAARATATARSTSASVPVRDATDELAGGRAADLDPAAAGRTRRPTPSMNIGRSWRDGRRPWPCSLRCWRADGSGRPSLARCGRAARPAASTSVRCEAGKATSSSGGLMSPARASRKARSSRPSRNPGPPAIRSASSVAVTAAFVADELGQREVGLERRPAVVGSAASQRRATSRGRSAPRGGRRRSGRAGAGSSGRSATAVEPSPGRRSSGPARDDLAGHPRPPRGRPPTIASREPGARRRSARIGRSGRRRSDERSAGTSTSSRRSRPDADPRIPRASKPGSRSTPGDSRSTRKIRDDRRIVPPPRRGARPSANRRAGSQVVQVFSPVEPPATRRPSLVAIVPGSPPRAGQPPPSSVDAALIRAPSSRIRHGTGARARPAASRRTASAAAPITCRCIAKPRAVDPSTAPIAARIDSVRPARRRSPPASTGSGAAGAARLATIAAGIAGSNASPGSSASIAAARWSPGGPPSRSSGLASVHRSSAVCRRRPRPRAEERPGSRRRGAARSAGCRPTAGS